MAAKLNMCWSTKLANLSPIPDGLTDEEVLMCPEIMSTGFPVRSAKA